MNNSIKPNSFQAWLLAMRPKTLTGAAIPVLLRTGLYLRKIPACSGLALLPVCLSDADGCQFHQRLVRLSEGN